MKVKESISLTFIFQLSIFLSCCVERITFGYLFESKYACLVQFYIHFFAVGKVHDNFVVTCELQQFGRFAVCFYAPALVCFIENQQGCFRSRIQSSLKPICRLMQRFHKPEQSRMQRILTRLQTCCRYFCSNPTAYLTTQMIQCMMRIIHCWQALLPLIKLDFFSS